MKRFLLPLLLTLTVSAVATPNIMLIPGSEGLLAALDPSLGSVLWVKKYEGFSETVPLIVEVNNVLIGYFTLTSGVLLAVDMEDGELAWHYKGSSQFLTYSPPFKYEFEGRVYVGAVFGNELCILDALNGSLLAKWRLQGLAPYPPCTSNGRALLAAYNYTTDSTTIYLLEGLELREVATLRGHFLIPVNLGDSILISSRDGVILEMSWKGRILRSCNTGFTLVYEPIPLNSYVVAASFNGSLLLLDNELKILRKLSLGGHIGEAPLLMGGLVYVSMVEGRVVAIDWSEWRVVWNSSVGGHVWAKPLPARLYDGRLAVLVITANGFLNYLDPLSGELIASLRIPVKYVVRQVAVYPYWSSYGASGSRRNSAKPPLRSNEMVIWVPESFNSSRYVIEEIGEGVVSKGVLKMGANVIPLPEGGPYNVRIVLPRRLEPREYGYSPFIEVEGNTLIIKGVKTGFTLRLRDSPTNILEEVLEYVLENIQVVVLAVGAVLVFMYILARRRVAAK